MAASMTAPIPEEVEPASPGTCTDTEVAELAYRLWEERGSPDGSPDQDWYQAEELLRNRQRPE